MRRTSGVRQFAGVVRGRDAFNVYECEDPRLYVFRLLTPEGYETEIEIPVRKRDLKTHIYRSLKHYGYWEARYDDAC